MKIILSLSKKYAVDYYRKKRRLSCAKVNLLIPTTRHSSNKEDSDPAIITERSLHTVKDLVPRGQIAGMSIASQLEEV